jgi:hypothetical protein
MKLVQRILAELTLLISAFCLSPGQVCVSDFERAQIESEVREMCGTKYYSIRAVNVDSLLKAPKPNSNPYRDSYRTLSGCWVFVAEGLFDGNLFPKGFIGVFRDGNILRRSEGLTEFFSSETASIISAMDDLNNDGIIDIIVVEAHGTKEGYKLLWIFSWNGKQGKILSARNEYGESTLELYAGFYLSDDDKDGVKEIRGEWYENDDSDVLQKVTYTWDGNLYGKWN